MYDLAWIRTQGLCAQGLVLYHSAMPPQLYLESNSKSGNYRYNF